MSYKNIREESVKAKVARDVFDKFDCTDNLGAVDFSVKIKKQNKDQIDLFDTQYFLWAEAKQGTNADINESLVQLILTIGKARTFDKNLPPIFLGAFDAEKIAFIPYSEVHEVFYQNDFNWTVTPSDHSTKEFLQLHKMVESTLEKNSFIFDFGKDEKDLAEFVKSNFVAGKTETSKIRIDKNNFIVVYNKWLEMVKPSIEVNWEIAKKSGIIDGDFYLADLLSKENETLKDKLFVLLKKDRYELARKMDEMGMFSAKTASFSDEQVAHTQFWNRYDRPPKEEYWDYISGRRDLLVPQDVRERKGSFFTPKIWVEKSQEYIADVLGENWQDEYFIWDCAAGTGNLLAGLTNKYNIWASTLDKADVDVMHDRISVMNENSPSGNGANLLADHCFQFDFLNDSFDKLPEGLQKIINDPEKRKKLVIYINPPYAEAGDTKQRTGTGKNKENVALGNKSYLKYKDTLGRAINELFAQFFARIYSEVSDCILAEFSTLKFVQGSNFKKFRRLFLSEFKKGFVVPADTFDNVKGDFPIGFKIWNTGNKIKIDEIICDVFNGSGDLVGRRKFYSYDGRKLIGKLLPKNSEVSNIGMMNTGRNDFQNQNLVHIMNETADKGHSIYINKNNVTKASIFFAVRHVFPATWLNDRDQFLFPRDGWQADEEFKSDCLTYTLFHGQNRISSKIHPPNLPQGRSKSESSPSRGIEGGMSNHWIPFTEEEVNARDKFDSNFMTDFIAGKIEKEESKSLFDAVNTSPTLLKEREPMEFSAEAKAVFRAGRELWKYYHAQKDCNVNASFYDIRKYFQGVNKSGRMNSKSDDEKYTELIGELRENLKLLAKKIQPKVYEYGFLKE